MSTPATLSVDVSVQAQIGASLLGFQFSTPRTDLVDPGAHDKNYTVPAFGGSPVTLWDAAVDAQTTFTKGFVLVDPDLLIVGNPGAVDIEITNNGVASLWRVNSVMPHLLNRSSQTTGAITKIRAVPVSGQGAMQVRCVLYPFPS